MRGSPKMFTDGLQSVAYGEGPHQPSADGTITQEAAATYGVFRLSPLDNIGELKGYMCNGWYNITVRLDMKGSRPMMVVWPTSKGGRALFLRIDNRRVCLVAGDYEDLTEEEKVRAIMSYPWGPQGIGIEPEVSYGE